MPFVGLDENTVTKVLADALSVRKLENSNLEVGVHIADVTHFVPVNSLTDQVNEVIIAYHL